ncbi:MAG: hypothetical protein IT365_29455 [Candidatus Hydrogenedentes bacterium]|nr:hypothetical protein [Candidatus Hydrogenedentota bacterium]
MPRLNLDIFGSGAVADTPTSTHKSASEQQTPAPAARATTQVSVARHEGRSAESSVRFIPVGFHEKHLRLLDAAVHELRKKGHYKASKSGIIRLLIERHAHELEDVWRSGARTVHEH